MADSELPSLEIRLELHSMQTLLTVLANVARLGCAIRQVKACENVVDLELAAPAHIAHRVPTCLGQLVGVTQVRSK
jgi:hypothetical protein